MKTILFEPLGIIFSFVINFKASAKLCNIPNGPTILGPLLNWIRAKTFLSAYTKKATDIKTGTTTARIWATIIKPGIIISLNILIYAALFKISFVHNAIVSEDLDIESFI